MINALAHVIVTEGLVADAFVAERCDTRAFEQWRDFVSRAENSPEATAEVTGVPAEQVREAARLMPPAATRRSTTASA
jgi:formate dehydrogenase major subunit